MAAEALVDTGVAGDRSGTEAVVSWRSLRRQQVVQVLLHAEPLPTNTHALQVNAPLWTVTEVSRPFIRGSCNFFKQKPAYFENLVCWSF